MQLVKIHMKYAPIIASLALGAAADSCEAVSVGVEGVAGGGVFAGEEPFQSARGEGAVGWRCGRRSR